MSHTYSKSHSTHGHGDCTPAALAFRWFSFYCVLKEGRWGAGGREEGPSPYDPTYLSHPQWSHHSGWAIRFQNGENATSPLPRKASIAVCWTVAVKLDKTRARSRTHHPLSVVRIVCTFVVARERCGGHARSIRLRDTLVLRLRSCRCCNARTSVCVSLSLSFSLFRGA